MKHFFSKSRRHNHDGMHSHAIKEEGSEQALDRIDIVQPLQHVSYSHNADLGHMAVHGLSCGDIIRQLVERDLRKYNPPSTPREDGQPGGQRVIFNANPVRTKHKSKTYQLEEYA